jgi:hypothetical protein
MMGGKVNQEAGWQVNQVAVGGQLNQMAGEQMN